MNVIPGMRFGALTTKWSWKNHNFRRIWKCTCECGGYCYVKEDALINGIVTDCGKCEENIATYEPQCLINAMGYEAGQILVLPFLLLSVLNTKITQKFQSEFYVIADVTGVSTGQVTDGYHNVSKMSNGQFRYSAHFTCYPSAIPNGNIVGYLPESANPYQIVYEYTYDITNQKWVRIRIGNNDRSIQLMNLDGTNVTSQRVELEYHIDF